jgi:hypothetical protein
MIMAQRTVSRAFGYRCPMCSREFARAEHLVRHKRTRKRSAKEYEAGPNFYLDKIQRRNLFAVPSVLRRFLDKTC